MILPHTSQNIRWNHLAVVLTFICCALLAIKMNVPNKGPLLSCDDPPTAITAIKLEDLSAYPFNLDRDGIPTNDSHVPAAIRQLDGKYVEVSGFMTASALDQGPVKFFVLSSPHHGANRRPLQVNQWIFVTMNRPIKQVLDRPIRVRGHLHVGLVNHERQLSTLYRVDGERVD